MHIGLELQNRMELSIMMILFTYFIFRKYFRDLIQVGMMQPAWIE